MQSDFNMASFNHSKLFNNKPIPIFHINIAFISCCVIVIINIKQIHLCKQLINNEFIITVASEQTNNFITEIYILFSHHLPFLKKPKQKQNVFYIFLFSSTQYSN